MVAIIYCKGRPEVPRKRMPKSGKQDKGYLGAFLGAGYARDRGLGFSPEAAPSWDADALFQMDKAGPWPSRDARETGLKRKQDKLRLLEGT